VTALFGQLQGQGLADTTAAAGDDRHEVFELPD
jgi:hypothetical protein